MSTVATTPLDPPVNASDEDRIMARMLRALDERAPVVDLFQDYFEGRHRLAFVSSPYRAAFGRMLAGASDNWCALVVEAAVERLDVQAFRVGDNTSAQANEAALELWRRDGMDVDAPLAFKTAAKIGEAYLLCSRDPATNLTRITAEHPRQFIVARSPVDRRVITAALKVWWDEVMGASALTLWTPNGIYRRWRDPDSAWFDGREVDDVNTLGRVPVAPLVNDPQLVPALPPLGLMLPPHNVPEAAIGLGRSDLADIISTQDAIDQLVANMLVAAEFAAFRQRWATGIEVPRDPDTGEPIEPFRSAVDRLWISENPDSKFGEFQATDLSNYIGVLNWLVQSIASRTRIPPHILMSGSGNWPSGESLRAAETGLVSKVTGKARSFGPAISDAIRIATQIDGGADPGRIAVDWAPYERRIESEVADAMVKRLSVGVPPQQLWEDYGYSPEEIASFSRLLDEAREMGLLADPNAAPAVGAPPPPRS